jgi:hypothetical protein
MNRNERMAKEAEAPKGTLGLAIVMTFLIVAAAVVVASDDDSGGRAAVAASAQAPGR